MAELTNEELESFRLHAVRNMTESDGSQCQWADYTVRMVDEIRRRRLNPPEGCVIDSNGETLVKCRTINGSFCKPDEWAIVVTRQASTQPPEKESR